MPQPRRAPKDDDSKANILARVRSAEGHMRAVEEMVSSDAYCVDVLQQTAAIRAALVKVESMLLERHLRHCVASAIGSENRRERQRAIEELLEVFEKSRKST